jgi:hypothetical protein
MKIVFPGIVIFIKWQDVDCGISILLLADFDRRCRTFFNAIKTTDALRVLRIFVYFDIGGATLFTFTAFSTFSCIHRELKTAETVKKRVDGAKRTDKTTEWSTDKHHCQQKSS